MSIKVSALFALALLVLPAETAMAKCDCRQFETLPNLSALSGGVAGLGLPGIDKSFELMIPEECRKKKNKKQPKVSLRMRGGLGGKPRVIEYDKSTGERLLNTHRNLFEQFNRLCPPPSGPVIVSDGIVVSGETSDGGSGHTFPGGGGFEVETDIATDGAPITPIPPPAFCQEGATRVENAGRFLEMGRNYINGNFYNSKLWMPGLGPITDEELRVLHFYNEGLRLDPKNGGAAYLEFLKKNKDKLSFREKILLGQMWGYNWDSRQYDDERRDDGVMAKGVEDLGELLEASTRNTNMGYYAEQGDVSYRSRAGICRDHASGQGEILEALGVPNVFVVSFATTKGFHSTVIAQDDANPSTVHKLNWGDYTTSAGRDGGQAVFVGQSDAGLVYFLSKPKGRTVASVQSEFGKAMAEAAGFDGRNIEPMARPNGSFVATDVRLDDSGKSRARVFTSSDGNGARYTGAAYEREYGRDTKHEGKVGVVLGSQNRPLETYGRDTVDFDFIYAQVEQKLNSGKWKTKNEGLSARIETMATAMFMLGRKRDQDGLGNFGAQGDLRLNAGVRVNQGTWRDRFASTYYAGAQIVPGIKDIRDNHIAQSPIPVLNHLLFSAEGRLRLSKTPEGRAYLAAATTVLADYFGLRGRAEIALVMKKFVVSGKIEGRLDKDSPVFKEGSVRSVSGTAGYQFRKNLTLGVTGSRTLEDDTQTDNYSTVLGTLNYTY